MQKVELAVAPHGAGWAVKHNGGFLGHVRSRPEALAIARTLAEWTESQGRAVEVRIENVGPAIQDRARH